MAALTVVILSLLGAGVGWVILYFLISAAVRDGVGKALRDHDNWRRDRNYAWQGPEPRS